MTTTITVRPKSTKAEREAQRKLQQAQVVAANEALQAVFETNRPALWLTIWVRALRLELLRESYPDFREDYSWWFEQFKLNAYLQEFQVLEVCIQPISEATLQRSDHARILAALDDAISRLDDFLADKERKRLEALELQRKRDAILARFTDEEKQLVGLAVARRY